MYGNGEIFLADLTFSNQYFNVGLISLILTLIVHIAFAIGIYNDSSARQGSSQHLWFVSPIFWSGAILMTGIFGATIYWVMHYSSLSTGEKPPEQLSKSMLPINPDPKRKRD